jgi:predicted Ser/Thr protein kinase
VFDETFAPLQQLLSGQYVLERELGRGGMGVVYLARELRLDRAVAVKVLPRSLGANPDLRERFLREARTAAQLSHPNIVPIFRADEVDGFAYFTMAFIEGESLAERLRDRGPFSPAEAVRVLREAAWALAYAHARGLVHRDVKPENIMIERGSNRVIVTDFGIARDQLASALTQDGMVLGSVHYMSPEQAAGDKLDGRSDLYSLGVVGFQILSGRRPFDADNAASVMAQQVTRPAPSLASLAPGLPPGLAAVIDRCLSKSPADRYPNGESLAEALQAALQSAALPTRAGSAEEVLGTEQARAIWLRAAQLQAEAASRLQARYREADTIESGRSALPSGGFRLHDVELAASEAGIAHEYVAMAIAERPTGPAAGAPDLSVKQERRLTQMLGTRERSISCSRVIRGTPKMVLEAIGQVLTAPPFSLKLRDTVGGHPLDGGVMVFDVTTFRSGQLVTGETAGSILFRYRMKQIEVGQLNVVLRPVGWPSGACEVTVYGDLRKGLSKNWLVDRWISGIAAAGGAASGTALGLAAFSLGPFAALTALAGAGLLGGASLAWYRLVYRYALNASYAELEQMIAAVEGELRAASVFGSAAPGARALRAAKGEE